MLDNLLQLDRQLLVFLNNFGSERFDFLWLLITKQAYWTPFFLTIAFFLYKKIGLKNLGIVVLLVTILLAVGNESVEWCKQTFQRLRPCNDPAVMHLIRIVKPSSSFSFFSGHATNSASTMVMLFLILKKYYKYSFLILLYPLIFAYSRIYLGVHYPSDILTGYVFGAFLGIVFNRLYLYVCNKYGFKPLQRQKL